MLVLILFNVVKSFTNSKCLVDKATFIQLFKCKHSYLNFCKHSTNKQIDPCGRGSLTRSARRRRRGMNDAYMYTVLTLSLHFLTHYTVATYIWPTLYFSSEYIFPPLHRWYAFPDSSLLPAPNSSRFLKTPQSSMLTLYTKFTLKKSFFYILCNTNC